MARPGPFQYPKTVKMAARAARLPSVALTLAAPPASEPIIFWVLSGNTSKAYAELGGMENACREEGISYTFAMWDARLPETTQSATARAMLDKGAPVNIFEFTPKSVLPPDGKGVEHMYSFDYAYRVPAFRTWLFSQKK